MKKIICVVLVIISSYLVFDYFNNLLKNDIKVVKYNKEIDDYLVGVVACEMPALYHEEALKAQTIAARTYSLYHTDNINKLKRDKGQCYITEEEMREKWGNNFELYFNKIKNIVYKVSGIIMHKDNKLFKSFYFSTSNGYTEDSITVFNEENIKSVKSPWDKESSNYYREITYTKENLENILGEFEEIKIISRNETNHVTKVKVDSKTYSGIEFRELLGLRSTDFVIEDRKDKFIIKTYGYGHGVGMSQTGANELAKLGYSYEYILDYYYNDIDLINLNV